MLGLSSQSKKLVSNFQKNIFRSISLASYNQLEYTVHNGNGLL